VHQLINDTCHQLRVHDPESGYDLAASAYEIWHWFQFWRRNETPLVQLWTEDLVPGTFLDAGAGTGPYRFLLEGKGHRVIAADLSIEMLRIQLQRNPNAPVVRAKLEALPFLESSFDYLLCTRVLSHIRSVGPTFNEFARVTKSGAKLLITDVHPEHRYSEMSISMKKGKVSIQTYKHAIGEIKAAIEAYGFELIELREFRLKDLLWKPPVKGFENIYDEPTRPIFYTCSFRHV
jgi:ubiquinone/menaquinone biosynthesis C-methylase UbiE